jgi:hypothetical protein
VRAEDEAFGFEDEHGRYFTTKRIMAPSSERKALRAVLFPALKRWANEVVSLRDAGTAQTGLRHG